MSTESSLLPIGLYDQLPPHAESQTQALARLLSSFADFGYAQVNPPLVEFEESLLSGRGADLATQTFRLMDPLSRRMLAFRADMTPQIARIATDRLADAPRPLRLCYSGQTLRVQGEALRPRRQHRQVGLELIGSETLSEAGDLEVISVALHALRTLGIEGISIDLNAPGLIAHLLAGQADQTILAEALARKDVSLLGTDVQHDTLRALVASVGSQARAVPALRAVDLPPHAAAQRDKLCHAAEELAAQWPDITISVDAVEARGFEYHHGLSFSLFATGSSQEIGRGGRYRLEGSNAEATGVTLYMDALQPLLPQTSVRDVVLMCGHPTQAVLAALHTEGKRTLLAGVSCTDATNAAAQARAHQCNYYWMDGQLTPVINEKEERHG